MLLAAASQVSAQDSARQWLDEMSSALQTLDYDGTFVYLHDGRMDAMRIIHQMSEGGQSERLVSLTGSAREVLRDDKAVTCIKADNKSVMIGKSRPRPPFPVLPRDLGKTSRNYQIEDVGDDRMAGYDARVIAITPKDEFRYGYRFWIEQNTRMLLKYDLSDPDGVPIEQVMFTRVKIGADIPPGRRARYPGCHFRQTGLGGQAAAGWVHTYAFSAETHARGCCSCGTHGF
jgi:sigma-E factor negative regulatory protein RseB